MTTRVQSSFPRLASAALIAMALALAAAPGAAASATCRPDADELRVTFQPVDHSIAPASWFRARLTLRNTDRRCALADGWRLFFNSVRQPLAVYPPGPLGDAARQQLAAQGLTVARADDARSGDYYVLEPTASFDPVGPGRTREITIDIELWAILKSDAPAGWHISFDGGPPRWVPAAALLDPSDPKQTSGVRRRQASGRDARNALRAEHRATDGARARRPHPAAPARGRASGAASSRSTATPTSGTSPAWSARPTISNRLSTMCSDGRAATAAAKARSG